MKIKAIFITGPTASGKSDLAILLAKKFNTEIINADSRQVYKHLNIGSGKITKKEQQKIKHHLLNIAHPKRNYSLGRWLKDINKVLNHIRRRTFPEKRSKSYPKLEQIQYKALPIFCGGTILYLKAIKEGWILPNIKPDYQLRKKLEKKSNEELYQEIKKLNPQRAKNLDPNNKRRLIRALEIIYKIGKVPKIKKEPKFELLILAPRFKKTELFKKIKIRLEKRIPGIIKEIKKLRKIGLSFKRIISFGLEYKWFGMYVMYKEILGQSKTQYRTNFLRQGKHSTEQVLNNRSLGPRSEPNLSWFRDKCYQDIIRFAKRQIRELKKIDGVNWVTKKEAVKMVREFLSFPQ